MSVFIGCAGWNVRKEHAEHFASAGTHLERYAGRMNAVEINSSFYRAHRPATYQRWAESTSDDFRFSVKLPRQITHVERLVNSVALLERFLSETSGLGPKRGAILVQLPPALRFERAVAEPFFDACRRRTATPIVCEPRHASWFGPEADAMLAAHGVARAAADPAVVEQASRPGGDRTTCYFRWHGSPRVYYSSYEENRLCELAGAVAECARQGSNAWCIFDNTALGAAVLNALDLCGRLLEPHGRLGQDVR